MTTASGVAVVATQLARTDRRALSQAWYSALHLERAAAAVPSRATGATGACIGLAPPRATHAAAASVPSPGSPTRSARGMQRGHDGNGAIAAERRGPVDRELRRFERAVERIARTPAPRGSQTLVLDGGRVTLLVREDRSATRVVAVCSEPLRATVERALAHARYALAAGGRAVRAS